ncbi:TolC family protein [Erythrobacter arachoides]|uniref:TolC family protein n=1 Tax=Aurantiacibacter arachoides TaxID=1850444 RepID=A0A845A155_9SPHN|nr:TolC family protein [Aurantiacibacter arachoides]MXO94253.1 TolC family protein [Aurantiacibacter arachoides]GGD64929.1 metal transporter [Aurantiacibacter arachoides]
MFAKFGRGTLIAGLAFAMLTEPAIAQDASVVSLEEALDRTGVADGETTDATNPRIVGPRAESEAARALVGQARLRPNPEVSLEVENIAGSGAYSGLNATEYTVAVGQRIELSGKRGARVEAAQAQAQLADLRADLAGAELGFLVRDRYVAAAAAAARAELARDVVERNEELARIAGVLVEVGREPPLRAMRAEATLAEARAELQAAEAVSLAARAALASLWGAQGNPPLIPGDFPDIQPPGTVLVWATGLQLQVAHAESTAAAAEIERERSLRVPDPVVSAGVRRFEESNDNAFLVGVSIPLPFGNRNQSNIAAAEARLRAANAREAVALADFEQSIIRARTEYLAAGARVETLSTTSLPQAEEALRLVRIGYRNGRFPLIEVLSAAEARDAIREALIAAQEDRGQAAAELIRLAAQ